jgi:hypothetical protein
MAVYEATKAARGFGCSECSRGQGGRLTHRRQLPEARCGPTESRRHGRTRALEGQGQLTSGAGREAGHGRVSGSTGRFKRARGLVMIRQLGRRLVMIRQWLKAEQFTAAWLGRSRRSGQGRLPGRGAVTRRYGRPASPRARGQRSSVAWC